MPACRLVAAGQQCIGTGRSVRQCRPGAVLLGALYQPLHGRPGQPAGRRGGEEVSCSAVRGWRAWCCLLFVFGGTACGTATAAHRPAQNPSASVSPSPSSPAPTLSPSRTPAPPLAAPQAPPPPPPPPPQASVAVAILDSSAGCTDGRYNPPSITIRSNTVVTWTNSSGEAHTATSNQGAFDTGNIARGATSKGITFSRPGTYAYHCIYHSCMTATVIVT